MSALTNHSVIVIGDALETVLERALPKIHEQPERQVHQTEIRENLLTVDRCKPLHRLDLDNKPPFYKQVDLERVVYDNAPIIQRQGNLALDDMSGLPERFRHQSFVSTLKQSWSKITVQMESAIDRDAGKLFELGIS
jgi:hypothetical protein